VLLAICGNVTLGTTILLHNNILVLLAQNSKKEQNLLNLMSVSKLNSDIHLLYGQNITSMLNVNLD